MYNNLVTISWRNVATPTFLFLTRSIHSVVYPEITWLPVVQTNHGSALPKQLLLLIEIPKRLVQYWAWGFGVTMHLGDVSPTKGNNPSSLNMDRE